MEGYGTAHERRRSRNMRCALGRRPPHGATVEAWGCAPTPVAPRRSSSCPPSTASPATDSTNGRPSFAAWEETSPSTAADAPRGHGPAMLAGRDRRGTPSRAAQTGGHDPCRLIMRSAISRRSTPEQSPAGHGSVAGQGERRGNRSVPSVGARPTRSSRTVGLV